MDGGDLMPEAMITVSLFTYIVGGMAIAIATLSGFLGKLFMSERQRNSELRKLMRDDDKAVIAVLIDVQKYMSEARNDQRPQEILTLLRAIDSKIDILSQKRGE